MRLEVPRIAITDSLRGCDVARLDQEPAEDEVGLLLQTQDFATRQTANLLICRDKNEILVSQIDEHNKAAAEHERRQLPFYRRIFQ